jgi:hypothetical protein
VTSIASRRAPWAPLVALAAALAAALWLTAAHHLAVWWILVWGMPVLGSATMGLLLRLRVAHNPIGWLFLGIGFAEGVGVTCEAYAAPALRLPGAVAAAVVANVLEPLPLFLLPGLLLLFPEGRLPSRRWRPVAVFWAAAAVVIVLGIMLGPGAMSGYTTTSRRNPLGLHGPVITVLGGVSGALFYLLLVVTLAAAVSLVLRFRRATGALRQQLKWFGAAAAFLAATLVAGPLGLWSPWNGEAWVGLWAFGVTTLVVATGIAILRYRLYQIDVIIRKTLIYATLIGSLAVVYLGFIYGIGSAFQAVTGQSGALAVTASTLLVAVMFQPFRSRIQRAVDHRFYRHKYDATRTLDAFASRLRDQIDLDALLGEVLGVVDATVQPSHASVWLRTTDPLVNDH